ncbi:Dyp-type peroxidase [Marinomonas epiphytica]
MTAPYQTGILADASSDALFITLNVKQQHLAEFKSSLSKSPTLISQLQAQYPDSQLHASLGFSHKIWRKLDSQQPKELAAFPHLKGAEFEAVSTDVDMVIHVRSMRHDVTYELANVLFSSLSGSVDLVEEVSCFKYLDNRDLTGFVDGTENPAGDHKAEVALVGDEDSHYTNGSYLNLMKFVHDLDTWQKLDIKTQEDTYGRTKADNIEYPGGKKSLHAHTKRTSLKDEHGQSIEILRHSMPFASLTEKGLMFASYSRTPNAFNSMLRSMIIGDKDGHTDHLMRYTQAKTGQAFFVPALAWFNTL